MNEQKVYSFEEIEKKSLLCPFCKKTYLELCQLAEKEPTDLDDLDFSQEEFCIGAKCKSWINISCNGGYCGRFKILEA